MELSIRKKGIIKILIGIIAFIVISFLVVWLTRHGYTPRTFMLIVLGTPVAIGFVGLLEVLMNRPFSEMEDWWNNIKGWQRVLIGVFVVIVVFGIIIVGVSVATTLGFI